MEQKSSNEFMPSQPLKKIIPQLLLSLSLFSFLFSYSSHYYSSLIHSPNFPSNSFHQILNRALNKNCLFLICNGLLVFLAKTSGLIRPPPEAADSDLKRLADTAKVVVPQVLEKLYVLEETSPQPKEEVEEEEEEEEEEANEKSSEGENDQVSIFIAESEEEEGGGDLEDRVDESGGDERRSCWLFDEGDEQLYGEGEEEEEDGKEEEEEEEEEMMSTEEMNKKFEDFIRRMKEEIMINEARQKVVMVN
ncbi:hypothetical protein Salat_0305800 [Sesamum alatum]|uniref:Uncharacterized protein n=1 Tax=Sesamum alatum TaxID=300844 RepID=A0AAE1Z038_9LAMI|nr:hypothetical protein Salat_0305800 [Sesamum alatum]